ncbi:MAG TPA: acyltransferase [Methylomirabilota bacterium]|nr:acyltransferase [Methylomirabilota bacterium]
MARIGRVIADLVGGAILWIPGRVGSSLRIAYYRARGATIGPGCRFDTGLSIDRPDLVSVGPGTWLDRFAILIAGPPRPGRETRFVGSVELDAPAAGRIAIGARCHIGPHTILSGIGGLIVGDEVTLAAGCKVYSLSHHYRSWARPDDRAIAFGSQVADERQSMVQGTIEIGRNVGVGVDSLILPGTRIGEDSFVRPMSVVMGSWPSNCLLAGNPATREGARFASADDAS